MNSEKIMEATSQGLEVFQKYIPTHFKLGQAFKSPLREDKNPSFNIYRDESGKYLFKDFARDLQGDAIEFTKLRYGLDFKGACQKIAQDFQINWTPQQPPQHHSSHKDAKTIALRPLNEAELSYWEQFDISQEVLDRYGVQAGVLSSPTTPVFTYPYGEGLKVYRPRSENRFYYHGGKDEDFVFGYEQLPNKGLYLIFAAGEKDVMSLAAKGFHAVTLNSEVAEIPVELLKKLKSRFRYLLVCYDQDDAGKRAMRKHCRTHTELISVPLPLAGTKQSKDVSDYFWAGRTREDFAQLLTDSIHKFFEQSMMVLKEKMFDFNREIKEPVPVCTLDGQKMLTVGNLSVVAGKAKSGKSALCQSVISGAIAKDGVDKDHYFLGLDVVPNKERKAVLHFDTEQALFDYQKKIRNCVFNAGHDGNVEYFNSFHLLEFTPWERLKYIEHAVHYFSLKYGGVYLMVIDGVADLVSSVNDEEACNKLVDTLHRIATEHNAAILLVLHLNPDGGKTRGHLGSQLDRKAESIIMVETEGDVHNVNPKLCRNAGTRKIGLPQFAWNDDLRRFVYVGAKSAEARIDRRRAESQELLEIAQEHSLSWKRSDLRDLIVNENGLGRSAAYQLINFMVQEELLHEEDDGTLRIL